MWFGAVISKLGDHLKSWMESDLEEIHFSLRVTTDVMQLLRAVEKYFGGNANYPKGKGQEFMAWMRHKYRLSYLYPVCRACGGSRQDIGVEGAVAVLMNVPYYLEFLIWRFKCGHKDGILERNLFMLLTSVEMISLLRVLSILHISVCMPLRWLAANCGDLGEYGFGVADMATVVDLMDEAFFEMVNNGEKVLDEDFMMDIFKNLKEKLPPLQEYLDFMFEDRQGCVVGSSCKEDKVLPWDLLKAQLFYPTRCDIVQSQDDCVELASEAAQVFRREFRDERKATHKYLSEVVGERSIGQIGIAEKEAGLGISASNCVSERGHGASTSDLQTFGTIDLQHMAARGQTEDNNDFGRELRVGGRKSVIHEKESRGLGGYHQLMQELQRTLILSAKWNLRAHRDLFKRSFKDQLDTRQKKEMDAMMAELEKSKEDYIDAMVLYEQYYSQRCWRTKPEAKRIYSGLTSESARLEAVKVCNKIEGHDVFYIVLSNIEKFY